MLLDHLIKKLQARFPDGAYVVTPEDWVKVSFPAASEEFGGLFIAEEEGELIVGVGKFTHAHFNNYKPELVGEEHWDRIAEDTAQFIHDILNERIAAYGSHQGGGGVHRVGQPAKGFFGRLFTPKKMYVWSGRVVE